MVKQFLKSGQSSILAHFQLKNRGFKPKITGG